MQTPPPDNHKTHDSEPWKERNHHQGSIGLAIIRLKLKTVNLQTPPLTIIRLKTQNCANADHHLKSIRLKTQVNENADTTWQSSSSDLWKCRYHHLSIIRLKTQNYGNAEVTTWQTCRLWTISIISITFSENLIMYLRGNISLLRTIDNYHIILAASAFCSAWKICMI